MKFNIFLEEALLKIGLRKGDKILLHSDVSSFRNISGLSWTGTFKLIKNSFLNVLGENGALIVPTFNWDFCDGKTYIHSKTRSQTGIFSNYILSDESSVRSFHPIYSFCGIGHNVKALFENISNSSFGENSVFERLHKINAKIVMFNFNKGTTFVHYVEQKLGINYRYLKTFRGRVVFDELDYIDEFDMYVRFLDKDIIVSLDKLHKDLKSNNKMVFSSITNDIYLSAFNCNDLYKFIENKLKVSPYYLLKKPPSNRLSSSHE